MGWAHCGEDSTSREIGYAIEATCDHPGCTKEIDRGLDFACGGMHGEDSYYCEKYICHQHKVYCDAAKNFVCLICSAACAECNEEVEVEEPVRRCIANSETGQYVDCKCEACRG